MLTTALIVIISSFLWRVRGGLRIAGRKIPLNKIWYAVAFGFYGCFYFSWSFDNWLIGFIACYASYQLYGWGLYIGRLASGGNINPDKDKECELIDNLLFPLHITLKGMKYYLYQYPKLFGFVGTTLTGLIITFLWGLYIADLIVILSGCLFGVCYWLGSLCNKIKIEKKLGWGYGEWIAGAYFGIVLASRLS